MRIFTFTIRFSNGMKRFLIHIFTVLALSSIIAEDVYKCLGSRPGTEVYACDEGENDLEKTDKKEDDFQGKSFKLKESDFFLSLNDAATEHHTAIPESCSKFFHPSACLAIFSPPPNLG